MRVLLSSAAGIIWAAMPAVAADGKRAPEPVQLVWPSAARPIRQVAALPGNPPRLAKPFGVTVDSSGRLFVADPAHRALIVYHPDTGAGSQWKGSAEYPLVGPVAVAADQQGRIFAVDGYQARVVVFNPSGTPIADFGRGLLKRPEGIAIDSAAQRIYVGDVKLHQIFVFDLRTLKMERMIGDSPPTRFSSPAQVAVNSKGRLLVSDSWNCSVYVLDPGGALARKFPTQCARRGEFGRPRPIAVDAEDRVYVVDPNDDSLQIFDPDGKPLQFVRSLSKPSKPPAVCTGIALDREARVFVVDQRSGEGRLRIFAQGPEVSRRPAVQPAGDRRPQ